MSSDKEYRVKRSIASSIGEIDNILGTELTVSDIFPILEKLYKEDGEIHTLILKNIPLLLKNIPVESRTNYLNKLDKFSNSKEKWRVRAEYSKIVGNYSNVFDETTTFKQILPIAMHFCLDDVTIY
jgi:hypothetical protein